MRNLIRFLVQYHIAFLFVALQIFCLAILISYNNYHNIRFFSFSNEVSGAVNAQVTNVTEYISLKQINEELAEENTALKEKIKSAYLDTAESFNPFFDTAYEQQFSYTRAKVISASVNKLQNFLMINKGSKNGIERDMGVLSPSGVAGIVTEVSPNYATVMTLLHTQMSLSTAVDRTGYFGLLSWDGQSYDRIQLEDIPAHVDLLYGDTLVTQGAGGIFPPGQKIGFVTDWEELKGSRFYLINAEPATDFKKIRHVYIVKNKLKDQFDLPVDLPQF